MGRIEIEHNTKATAQPKDEPDKPGGAFHKFTEFVSHVHLGKSPKKAFEIKGSFKRNLKVIG